MKKLAFVLALLLLLSTFTGCGIFQKTYKSPAPLTEKIYRQLFPASNVEFNPDIFWSKDNQDNYMYRYYGTYNGYGVITRPKITCDTDIYTIAGYKFICSSYRIVVRKNGGEISLEDAYDRGFLTDKDIKKIYKYHKQTEPTLYEEYG